MALELLVAACGIYFPDQGSNLGLLHGEPRVLATGPAGKSLDPWLLESITKDLPVYTLISNAQGSSSPQAPAHIVLFSVMIFARWTGEKHELTIVSICISLISKAGNCHLDRY